MRRTENVTLATLAKRLNVTTTTVSKALRSKPGISAEMVQRVNSLARELKYSPNFAAQSLKMNSVDSIGVLVTSDINNPWYSQLVSCLEGKLAENGKTMILSLGKNDYVKERKCLQNFTGGRVAGVIVGPIFRERNLQNIWESLDKGLPMVMFNCMDELPVSYVAIDQQAGAKIAVEHLIDNGHKSIAYLCCPSGDLLEAGKTRKDGFEQALFEHDLPVFGKNIIPGNASKRGGYDAMQTMLAERRDDLPSAIFCHNDSVALGAMLAIQQAGLSIPDDISLIGFDDIEESSLSMPGLSTIGGVMHELSSGLVETMRSIIKNNPYNPVKQLIMPKLIKRKTVKQLI
jgi:LacI family transcriptional regulator, galactose operon repressor